MYGWIITRDLVSAMLSAADHNQEGTYGPSGIRTDTANALQRGAESLQLAALGAPDNVSASAIDKAFAAMLPAGQTRFRMFDDDGELYYEGLLTGTFDGLEPLDDFGMPNAGCTSIEVFEDGRWAGV